MNPILLILCFIVLFFAVLAISGTMAPLLAIGSLLVSGACVIAASLSSRRRPQEPSVPAGLGEATLVEPLRQVVETLPDPVIVVDEEGMVVMNNQLAADLFGALRAGQLLSGAVRSPVVLDAFGEVLRTGQSAKVDFEQRVPIERWFEVYLAPIPTKVADGEGINRRHAVLMLLRDLTQQERVERMRADFVAHASHELRTPLAAVLGFIETLQGAAKDDVKARGEFLELMRAQANRMTRLIDDLLSLSRIELHAHVRPETIINLERAVSHVLEYLKPLADEAGLEIKTSFEVDDPAILGDWDELVQVVQNLVDNAIKYGQSGEFIEVSITRGPPLPDGEASIDLNVRDFGEGIAPDHLPRLTERFYRVDVAQSRGKGGTGLGLAIVKHILNRHHGRLLIESKQGEGSRFTVRLPVAAPGTNADVVAAK